MFSEMLKALIICSIYSCMYIELNIILSLLATLVEIFDFFGNVDHRFFFGFFKVQVYREVYQNHLTITILFSNQTIHLCISKMQIQVLLNLFIKVILFYIHTICTLVFKPFHLHFGNFSLHKEGEKKFTLKTFSGLQCVTRFT